MRFCRFTNPRSVRSPSSYSLCSRRKASDTLAGSLVLLAISVVKGVAIFSGLREGVADLWFSNMT